MASEPEVPVTVIERNCPGEPQVPSGWTLYSLEVDGDDEEDEDDEAPPPVSAASGPALRASPREGGAQEGSADARRGTLDAARAAAAARRSWRRPRGVEVEAEAEEEGRPAVLVELPLLPRRRRRDDEEEEAWRTSENS